MAYVTDVFAPSLTLTERLTTLRDAWTERRAKAKIYYATLNELRVLSDRDLADLGISRANIPHIARLAAEGNN